jgi:hypothetical protein
MGEEEDGLLGISSEEDGLLGISSEEDGLQGMDKKEDGLPGINTGLWISRDDHEAMRIVDKRESISEGLSKRMAKMLPGGW